MSYWTIDSGSMAGKQLKLLTGQELALYKEHAPDAVFTSISGVPTKAKDCDEDMRYGYVAYGQVMSDLNGRIS